MTDSLDRFLPAYGEGFAYAFDNNILLNWYPERINALCPAKAKLLELGVGHGFTTNRFSGHFARHVVVDGSPLVIEQFRTRYPECAAEVVEAYFENFETTERFDVLVMGFVLEHVEDPVAILKKYRPLLASGGRLFIAVPNGASLHRRVGHAAGLLSDCMAIGEGDRELGHRRLYSVETLDADLASAGYRVVRKEGIFLKPLTTAQLVSLNLGEPVIRAMCQVGVGYPELSCGLLFEATAAIE